MCTPFANLTSPKLRDEDAAIIQAVILQPSVIIVDIRRPNSTPKDVMTTNMEINIDNPCSLDNVT